MSEWIARVMPLPVREDTLVPPSPQQEISRFRLRIMSPHSRMGAHVSGPHAAAIDVGIVRILALDTGNPHGGVGGSLDSEQAAWLVRELQLSKDRYVVFATHDSSLTMTSDKTQPGAAARVLGPEVTSILLAHRSVIAWVSGAMHHRAGRRHGDAGHGFWELPGSTDGRDAPLAGGLSISVRSDRHALIMKGALAPSHGSVWELRDPFAVPVAVGTAPKRPALTDDHGRGRAAAGALGVPIP
jgi:hypothetical protein